MFIFYFPDYVSSYSEYFVRAICLNYHLDICACADGYTLDLLTHNPNAIYKDLPSLSGFRELCVFNNIELDLLSATAKGGKKNKKILKKLEKQINKSKRVTKKVTRKRITRNKK